jgi:hypothetical protein
VVSLRPSSEHILIVRAPGAQDHTGFSQSILLSLGGGLVESPTAHIHRLFTCSLKGGLFGLPLRASNEGLLRPRVARAQETNSPLHSLSGYLLFHIFHLSAGGMGRSLTARIEGPLSEVGPLRANGTSHSARTFPSLDCPFPRLL